VVIPENEEVLKNANFTDNDPPILIVHNFDRPKFNFQNPSDNFSFLEPTGQMVSNDQFQTVRNKIAKLITVYRPGDWQSIEEICQRQGQDLDVDLN
jgi:hypothetical protein